MKKKNFVHLHLHTQYSLLDGAIKIDELAKKCVANNINSVAITDHGNMFGSYQFYKKMKKNNIKPIIGMEAYFTTGRMQDRRDSDGKEDIITDTTNYHLVLLAKNDTGLKNLMKLSTIAYKDGFYYKPRIDYEVLSQYSDGLIALTACLKGVPARNIVTGKENVAYEWIGKFKELFGNDLYLEVQSNSIPEQETANKELIKFAKKFGLKLVATNDAHYLNPEDAEAHQILLAMQTRKTIQQLKEESAKGGFGRYEGMHFALPEEMYEKFKGKWNGWEEALLNTLEIADKVSDTLDTFEDKAYKFPQFSTASTINIPEYFKNLAETGLKERIQKKQIDKRFSEKDYWDRLNYEISVIEQMGFEEYFLIVSDFVRWSKNNDVPVGPGRGSAAGSLVAYALNITDVDPLRHGLIFERFLNPERISMPDIDIDFCMDNRDKVINYVKEKYGENSVVKIGTYNTMKAKQTLKDVARTLSIPYEEADRLSKLIPQGENQGTWLSLEEMVITPMEELQENYNDNPDIISKVNTFRIAVNENKNYKELINIALKLEGLTRHTSLHAAGVVITPTDASNLIPLYTDKEMSDEEEVKKEEKVLATQYDMVTLEELGLVKMDFLGLKTLTELQKMKELIKQTKNIDIDFLSIDLDDPKVLEYISTGKTTGIFQLESKGMQNLLTQLKPSKFDELAAVLALYRPGPIQSGMVDKFVERKHDSSKIEYPFPELEDILKETYGLIVYQEQIMFISNKIAGFTMAQADALRKAIGKKKADLMAKIKEDFINKAVNNGYDEAKVKELWDAIEEFASYSFNKSHSVAYAYLSMWTAYMKYYYPNEFFAVKLSTENNDDKFINLLKDAKAHNIQILPPDINKSNVDFTIENENVIRYGLARIKGIGRETAEHIVEVRNNGIFMTLSDFQKRTNSRKINKKVLEALIKSGAMFNLVKGQYNSVHEFIYYMTNSKNMQQAKQKRLNLGANKEIPTYDLMQLEKEVLGFYISGHPLDNYPFTEKIVNIDNINDVIENEDFNNKYYYVVGVLSDIQIKPTKKGFNIALFNLIDTTGIGECVMFNDDYEKYKNVLKEGSIVVVLYSIDNSQERKKLIVKKMFDINEIINYFGITVKLNQELATKEHIQKIRDIIDKHIADDGKFFVIKLELNDSVWMIQTEYNVKLNKDVIDKLSKICLDYRLKLVM